jgi:hypothetical protein
MVDFRSGRSAGILLHKVMMSGGQRLLVPWTPQPLRHLLHIQGMTLVHRSLRATRPSTQ